MSNEIKFKMNHDAFQVFEVEVNGKVFIPKEEKTEEKKESELKRILCRIQSGITVPDDGVQQIIDIAKEKIKECDFVIIEDSKINATWKDEAKRKLDEM